jgi:hypothetical protein
VRQQVTRRDQGRGRVQDTHLGNMVDDRCVQIERAAVREHHRSRRRHDLRHRKPQKRRMNCDRPAGAHIGEATGVELHRTVGGHHRGSQAGGRRGAAPGH